MASYWTTRFDCPKCDFDIPTKVRGDVFPFALDNLPSHPINSLEESKGNLIKILVNRSRPDKDKSYVCSYEYWCLNCGFQRSAEEFERYAKRVLHDKYVRV